MSSGGSRTAVSKRWWIGLALLGLFGVALGVGVVVRRSVPPPRPLLLGMAPVFSREITRELRPFTDYLGRRLGRPVRIVVDRSYDDLRLQLVRGELDLAVLPHMQVVFARQAPRVPRMVAAMSYKGSTTYRSVIVVRDNWLDGTTDGDISDLAGKRFCWVNRGSASGYLVPRLFLRESGVDPNLRFASTRISGSHFAVLKDVIEGRCDAGATSAGWLQLAPKRGLPTNRIRVLAEAGRIPLDYICAARRLPSELAARLREALLELEPQRDLGRAVLGPHHLVDGFSAPRFEDFATLTRALRRERILPPR